MKKLLLTIAGILAFSFSIFSQTAEWLMPPGAYTGVTRIGPRLLKVGLKGKIGLMTTDGEMRALVENDSLTDFHENKALLLRNDGIGERVMGCLSYEGKYTPFGESFYTLNGQKFYSDGLLSVADEKGNVGYIDAKGARIVGFDGRYDRIKPFTEGYAAVFKNKKYHLINKSGIPVKFMFDGVGELYGGTNVFNGLAYVWDTDGNFYTYDVKRGGTCRKLRQRPGSMTFDYLYRIAEISGGSKYPPMSKASYSGTVNAEASQIEGLYGFAKNGTTFLPPQFSAASDFIDGYAVVTLHGQTGVLRYIEETPFGIEVLDSSKKFYANEDLNCEFKLAAPPSYQGKRLDLELRDRHGVSLPLGEFNGVFRFSHRPAGEAGIKDFALTVSHEGIRLNEFMLQYSFVKKQRCNVCGKDKEICGGHATPTQTTKTNSEPLCATCGKKISECKWKGVH